MVNIMSGLIDKKVKNMRFFLNYPKIEVDDEGEEVQRFAESVNKSILNEVSIFEEVVIYTYCDEIIIGNINAISEYNVAFNRGNIVSIPMEFSQLIGLSDISNIYSYNYDFNLMKEITLEDIFKSSSKPLYEFFKLLIPFITIFFTEW